MIKAIVFDLDDTLIPELEYVKSGFRAVANHFDKPDLYDKMLSLFLSDKNNVYDRAGLTETECAEAVCIYRAHKPDMKLDEDVLKVLWTLKESGYMLGIITDGRPEGQRNKIEALGLEGLMDHIIVTDELGGMQYRKPCPVAFELMAQKLNVALDEILYVGDNPAKDFYISSILPIKTVRLYSTDTTIYSDEDYYCGVKENCAVNFHEEIIDVIKHF